MEKTWKPVPDVEQLRYKGTPDKPDIKIFVSHRIDLDSETIDNPLYIPVRCGAVFDEREGVSMLGDDTGDNISEKRMTFCELTVQYWAWKNVKADYYGLCHYRRYLSFANQQFNVGLAGTVPDIYISNATIQKYSLLENIIQNTVERFDIITTKPMDINLFWDAPHKSNYELLKKRSIDHNLDDVDTLIALVKRRYPAYSADVDKYFSSTYATYCNCYIMKKDIFFEYNTWLFDILFEFERIIDLSSYSSRKQRIPAYMSEALWGIFYLHLKRTNKLKIKELQLVSFSNTKKQDIFLPAFSENNVPVAIVSSDYYTPYAATCLQSLVAHASDAYNYDFIILSSDMSDQNNKILSTIVQGKSNMSLRIYNPEPFLINYISELHFDERVSVHSFYRIVLPYAFVKYNSMICIDSDLIFERDIADLFKISVDHYLAAAVRDIIFQGFLGGDRPDIIEYCQTDYHITNIDDYVNTGVVIYNLGLLRKKYSIDYVIQLATAQQYKVQEQDVLNLLVNGNCKILDPRWNVTTFCNHIFENNLEYAPYKFQTPYLNARKNPYVIHYAGPIKPWNKPDDDFADRFWFYARQSPLYEVVLHRLMWEVRNYNTPIAIEDNRTGARKIADVLLPHGSRRRAFAKILLPKGSLRWRFCKQIYYIISPQYRPPKNS